MGRLSTIIVYYDHQEYQGRYCWHITMSMLCLICQRWSTTNRMRYRILYWYRWFRTVECLSLSTSIVTV